MSLYGLQSAIASIIRCPHERYQWDPDQFLKDFELTSQERESVNQLIKHPELNKYGDDQARDRWEKMLRHCDNVPNFVPDRVLKNIWFDLFEPQSLTVKSDLRGLYESSISFLKFLLNDEQARRKLESHCGDYIFDLIAFEIAELELSRPLTDDPPLRKDSILAHPHFRVVDFSYDIPLLLSLGDEPENISDLNREFSLAFVRDPRQIAPRVFEITEDLRTFLLSQTVQFDLSALRSMGLLKK